MVSNQISCFKNSKKLVELVDKLNPADSSCYGHLHAGYESDEKKYSLIGVQILDYSGEESIFGSFNLHPSDVKYVFRMITRVNDAMVSAESFEKLYGALYRLMAVIQRFSSHLGKFLTKLLTVFPLTDEERDSFEKLSIEKDHIYPFVQNPFGRKNITVYEGQKILSAVKDDTGRSPVKKITITYVPFDDQKKPRRSPWRIEIENGSGIGESTSTGGIKAKSGSYKQDTYLFVWLSSKEIECLFEECVDFIRVFEMTECFQAIREGRKLYEKQKNRKEGNG